MAGIFGCLSCPAGVTMQLAVLAALLMIRAAAGSKTQVISYYLQQEFGTNELQMTAAARPALEGTLSGFGQSVVYEFVMTETADPASAVMGYVRGTAVAVNNTAAATVFMVNNVVHYDYKGVQGTLSQQGEAVFTSPWEFVVFGGTGAFRHAHGYNLGSPVSISRTPSNLTHIVTHYDAHIRLGKSF
ncbi:hypothetical protein GOP47_0009419 [Adiantum capillus-veneris]|uniref:Dirigent protein n=1 Tax=Adiantum capillus-veneris TaxID=13818 RepID=A0A9D4UWJ1_ADICA|nr:hypothetical protein GOP47_0009419 [Adiantum capillus-veneris]